MQEYTENYLRSGGKRSFSEYYTAKYDGALFAQELTRNIVFSQHNLVTDRSFSEFNVIFCRNVLIYFDDASRRMAAENLYENLAPGGFICLGHTESMSRISPLFEVRRFAEAIVYQRPMEGARG